MAANERGLHDVALRAGFDLVIQQLAQDLQREVALGHGGDLGEELFGEDGDIGFFESGGGEDVDDLIGSNRA